MRTYKLTLVFIIVLIIGFITKKQLSAQTPETMPHGVPAGFQVPGYVILSNGDTLHGMIKWALKYVENNPVEIKFTAENGVSKSFNANEIKGFGNRFQISGDNGPKSDVAWMENYVSLPSFKKGVPVFLNRLLEGRITVYQNRSAAVSQNTVTESKITGINGITFNFSLSEGLYIGPTLVRESRIISERSHSSSYFVIKGDAPMIKVEKGNYESLFKTLFGDCDKIDQELAKNPDLINFKNFFILAEVYNSICN
jgi:hypothetical protein